MNRTNLGLFRTDQEGQLIDPRACTRRTLNIHTVIGGKHGLANVKAVNISPGGLGIHHRTALERGQYLTIYMYPDDGTATIEILLAKVRWVEEHCAGIALVSVSEVNHERLYRLCEGEVASD